jgi:hypothetical protein
MKLLRYPFVKFRSSYFLIGLVLVVSTILIGVVLFLHLWRRIPIGSLTRDISVIAGLPVYAGFLSQIGIFFWSASATICFFSVTLLWQYANGYKLKRFLLISGLLTLLLGLDDIFLLHETVFPFVGIPEEVVFGSYAALLLFYLVRFYPLILKTEYVLMVIALFFFGVSVLLDLFPLPGINPFLVEDSAKLIGILSWLAYFFQVGKYSVHFESGLFKPKY